MNTEELRQLLSDTRKVLSGALDVIESKNAEVAALRHQIEPLQELAQRLVDMDDSRGSEDRRTITLNALIEQARAALSSVPDVPESADDDDERPGQPGKNGRDHAGLVGRGRDESRLSPLDTSAARDEPEPERPKWADLFGADPHFDEPCPCAAVAPFAIDPRCPHHGPGGGVQVTTPEDKR